MRLTGAIYPAIAANQNDWAPSGWETSEVYHVSVTGSVDLTGIANGSKGRTLFLFVVAGTLTLKHASGSSEAANRFAIGADLVLAAGDGVILTYDATNTVWRAARRHVTAGAGSGISLEEAMALEALYA